jgi:chromosome segregation ATPase
MNEAEEMKEIETMNPQPSTRTLWIALGVLFALSLTEGIVLIGFRHQMREIGSKLDTAISAQGTTIQQLTRSVEQADQDLRGNFQKTEERIAKTQAELQRAQRLSNVLAQERKEAEERLASRLGQLQQEQTATQGTVGNLATDFSGVKQEVSLTKQEVSLTKEELASTRSELQRVIGDLGVQSDLIAHNQTELAQLRQRGEREYLEFDLRKSKSPLRVGAVALQLRKTDVKRQKYTLHLIADDRTIEKKEKTANEPVQFYQEGYRQPTEVVVNQIYKDRIVGYVSFPRQRESRPARSALQVAPAAAF